MQRTKQRDNDREKEIRSALHRSGVRFRIFYPVPKCPRRSIDIALVRPKIAIFVDGCFWHSCPLHQSQPKTNADWWREKLAKNRLRDAETNQLLNAAGWRVLRFWEHEAIDSIIAQVKQELAIEFASR